MANGTKVSRMLDVVSRHVIELCFDTVNPRVSHLRAYIFFILLGRDLFEERAYSRVKLTDLFDICCINSSLSKLQFITAFIIILDGHLFDGLH